MVRLLTLVLNHLLHFEEILPNYHSYGVTQIHLFVVNFHCFVGEYISHMFEQNISIKPDAGKIWSAEKIQRI